MLRLLLMVVLVLVALALLRLIRRPAPVSSTGSAVTDTSTRSTSRRHTEALAVARENLQHAQAAHARAVSAAQGRFIDSGLDLPVTSLERLHLGRLTLKVEERLHWLGARTRAEVDVSGEIRWETEEVDGRLRPVAKDERQVRVVVHDDGWREEQALAGDQVDRAQRFVSAAESTVRTLEQARSDRQRRIEVAAEELESARADTQELDLARMTVEDLEGAGPLRRDLPPAPERPQDGDEDGDEDRA